MDTVIDMEYDSDSKMNVESTLERQHVVDFVDVTYDIEPPLVKIHFQGMERCLRCSQYTACDVHSQGISYGKKIQNSTLHFSGKKRNLPIMWYPDKERKGKILNYLSLIYFRPVSQFVDVQLISDLGYRYNILTHAVNLTKFRPNGIMYDNYMSIEISGRASLGISIFPGEAEYKSLKLDGTRRAYWVPSENDIVAAPEEIRFHETARHFYYNKEGKKYFKNTGDLLESVPFYLHSSEAIKFLKDYRPKYRGTTILSNAWPQRISYQDSHMGLPIPFCHNILLTKEEEQHKKFIDAIFFETLFETKSSLSALDQLILYLFIIMSGNDGIITTHRTFIAMLGLDTIARKMKSVVLEYHSVLKRYRFNDIRVKTWLDTFLSNNEVEAQLEEKDLAYFTRLFKELREGSEQIDKLFKRSKATAKCRTISIG